jgi:putative ABC transport system permease protein
MRLGTIFYLYRVRLRARLVQELLAVAGIAVGVALLFASQVANTSLSGSVSALTRGLVGSARLQLLARSPSGFSESLLTRVDQMPSVRAAAPVLQRSVTLVGPKGQVSATLVGLNPRFLSLHGDAFQHLTTAQLYAQQGVALPAPVARRIGVSSLQPVSLQIGARSIETRVGLVMQASDIGDLVNSEIAVSPLGRAQRIAAMEGEVNSILVEPRPGRDHQVETGLLGLAAGRLNVLPANHEATVFSQAEAPTVDSTQMFAAISALVGFVFAFNAMLLTVPHRRNLIADLQLDGYASVEIVEVLLFDVFVLGAAGVLIGLGLGDLLSHRLLRAEAGYLSLAFPVGSEHLIRWQSVAIAAAGGLLATVIGVLVPLRREIFGRLGDGRSLVRRPNFEHVLVLCLGLVCLLITTVVLIVGIASVSAAIVAFVSLTLALVLLMPPAFAVLLALIDQMQRPLSGVASRIALIELMSSSTRSRSLAIAATGAIAVFGSVAIEGAQGNLHAGLNRVASGISQGADAWVSPTGKATTLATTPFSNSYRRRLDSVSGVGDVRVYRGGFLDLNDRRVLVLAASATSLDLLPGGQIVSGSMPVALARLRSRGWLVMSQGIADMWKLKVGDRFVLSSPVPRSFRVAALITNLGWPPGTILMNADDYALAWGSQDVSAYQIHFKPGVAERTGLAAVRAALHANAPGLVVQGAARHEQNVLTAQRQGLARLTQIAVLVLIAAALAMAAAMGAMIWQRRARLAGMKVDGYSPSELWHALLWETALLLSAGCAIGAAFGLYGQVILTHALVNVTGFPVVFSVGITIAAISLAAVTAIALAMVALPGYLAVQVKPALQD